MVRNYPNTGPLRWNLEPTHKGADEFSGLLKVGWTDRSWTIHDDANIHGMMTGWGWIVYKIDFAMLIIMKSAADKGS